MTPIWDLREVVATHQPDKSDTRKTPAQDLERVGGIGCRAEPGLDVGDPDTAVGGGDCRGMAQALVARGPADVRAQRVLRRPQPPDLIEIEPAQRQSADMQMPAMRR